MFENSLYKNQVSTRGRYLQETGLLEWLGYADDYLYKTTHLSSTIVYSNFLLLRSWCSNIASYELNTSNMHISVKGVAFLFAFLTLDCSFSAAKSAPRCNGIEYNPDFFICCGAFVYEKPDGAACCDYQPYSTYKQICCHGVILFKDEPCAD